MQHGGGTVVIRIFAYLSCAIRESQAHGFAWKAPIGELCSLQRLRVPKGGLSKACGEPRQMQG